uniref:1-acyl-sn-glycerol-3-phosphate acyltransferase n=1 Tax=Anthurium amnicola TaxID=1678845 RepID=A0A1D1ZD99_9ARAE
MGTLALLRPRDPLSLAPFRRNSLGAATVKAHRGISPPSNVFCSGLSCSKHDRKFRSLKLSCTALSWRKYHIARKSTIVKSGIAATAVSPDFSEHPLTESDLGSRIRGICFYTVTAAAAIFLFMAMALVHPFVFLFDRYRRKAHHLIAKAWASLTVLPFYGVEFEGLDNLPPDDRPAVYVSNHQSFLDIYTMLTLGKSFKFISKRGVFLFPIIGWAMFLLGMIPIRRMDTRSQLDCLKRCIELVKKGASVYFFPEGTRSKDGKLCAFKKGAFSIAAKTGAPIVPITLLGTGNLMPPGMEGLLNSGSVKVVIHKPLQGTNADMLCDNARNTIADTLLLHGYGVHQAE